MLSALSKTIHKKVKSPRLASQLELEGENSPMKLWSGRFTQETDTLLSNLTNTLPLDKRLYKQSIQCSKAHLQMLSAQGWIKQESATLISETLDDILQDIEAGSQEVWDPQGSNIHQTLQNQVVRRIGEVGHELAIARDDAQQNTLTLRLYLRQEVQQIQLELHLLQNSLLSLAKTHQNTMMPKHAHWQRVQPTTLAHHLMAYFEMLVRDRQRLQETEHRTNVMPVNEDGFSDTQALDRYLMARILDFPDITSNSIDALSDRDYCIELVSNLSILMMHLSRFCEELSIWNSQEFGLIEMASSFQEKETPHQYLPHIKPPTGAEIVGGKTGRLYGSLITLLTLTKGHALGSVKDFQECQEAVFDAVDTVKKVVPLFTEVLNSLTVNEERMKLSAEAGFVMAPRIVEHLKQKGVRPHKAMDIAGSVLLYAQQYNIALSEMKLKEFQKFCPLFDEDILVAVNLEKGAIQSLEREGSPLSLSFTKSENYLKFREYQLCTV